ncbi:bifunctional hydroxymethylpyrimidine kinase/phosphomethylpyrimidine kinase [Marinifilum sp. D737]|uniref:bifunctional hydroxymethylpyrimidine kinase/phosphomethylpyrimidine kinase n=1 Tax=Marinifilum sp. D737 TaxID=2969628 RepID=UPI002276FBBC|nr:bifunctional hydroxymethylpyrimidine kinase/phosphomethylpyrimidine kinase [Marinifilum sp. D737]MCY1635721.1 bifunctional hydroxymethylpyrimidine kinase/phosphomethylpyrimidine kinase [Marinifilum sp. D737]
MKYNKVLSIAGSDSGGGAGIQADIKAISACGSYAATAITAITVQNTVGVSNVHAIPNQILAEQIDAVLSDIGADAIKIGMLHSSETIHVVADALKKYQIKNVVLDPVMVATSGDKLLLDEAIVTLKEVLIPMVKVITPNIPEAEILLGRQIPTQEDVFECAAELSNLYKVSVLLKAGHLNEDELIDVFFDFEKQESVEMKSLRMITKNTHGTGCTMSSAFAAFLSQGYDLQESAKKAKDYINNAIIAGADYEIGEGHGPVNHFYHFLETCKQ